MTDRATRTTVTLGTAAALLALAAAVAARPNHCRKDCKPEIAGCLAAVPANRTCTGTKPQKRACRRAHAAQRRACHALVKLCREQNPTTPGTCASTTTT